MIHAVDKQTIVDKEFKGIDAPVNQLFPTAAPYSNVHLTPVWDYDLEMAKLLNCPAANTEAGAVVADTSDTSRPAPTIGECKAKPLDIIVTKGNLLLLSIEDDIRADLAKVGITLTLKELEKDSTEAYTTANPDGCVGECPGQGFNDAMTSGNFHLCFSESQGPPYDPQAFAASWSVPDEAYYAALKGLPAPNTYDVMMTKINDVLKKESEADRQAGWTEIFTTLHEAATELPISGKRMPAIINKRLSGYRDGLQQFDYPLHTLRVESGSKTVTISPAGQNTPFKTIGRLDAHSYRPNEFWANNMVFEGLVEYGPGGTILPALAASWTVADCAAGETDCPADGQKYTFTLRANVKFHDDAAWDCSVAKLNLDHVLHPKLRSDGDCGHAWYELPAQINKWSCSDDMTLVITTKSKYYPFVQELSFIRPVRFQSPNVFVGGAASDPTTQNSAPAGNCDGCDCGSGDDGITAVGVTGIVGTGRWKFTSKVDTDPEVKIRGQPQNDEVTFTLNTDHWDYTDAPWNVETLKVVRHADGAAVKAALIDESIDAVIGAGVLTYSEIVDFQTNHADKFKVSFTDVLQNRILIFNTGRAPTDDIQLRKVMIHAVDKQTIVDKEFKGIDAPVNQLFPKAAPYSNVHLTPVWDYDLQKAQLLNCPKIITVDDFTGAVTGPGDAVDSSAMATGALYAIIMAAFVH
jgi:ABC-type transport system substrate-binding protein